MPKYTLDLSTTFSFFAPIFVALLIAILFSSFNSVPPKDVPEPPPANVQFVRAYIDQRYPDFDLNEYIYVSIKEQSLFLIRNDKVVSAYPVSTARKGSGEQWASECIPRGLHQIGRKWGDGCPLNSILLGGSCTGKTARIIDYDSPKDHITNRSMELVGTETGMNESGNVDTGKRGIYIHGTHEEGLIGTPVSHGCVRMLNKDVLDLFDRVNSGTYVLILPL